MVYNEAYGAERFPDADPERELPRKLTPDDLLDDHVGQVDGDAAVDGGAAGEVAQQATNAAGAERQPARAGPAGCVAGAADFRGGFASSRQADKSGTRCSVFGQRDICRDRFDIFRKRIKNMVLFFAHAFGIRCQRSMEGA